MGRRRPRSRDGSSAAYERLRQSVQVELRLDVARHTTLLGALPAPRFRRSIQWPSCVQIDDDLAECVTGREVGLLGSFGAPRREPTGVVHERESCVSLEQSLVDLAIVTVVAALTPIVAGLLARLRVPQVVILIVGGILVGPDVLGVG